MHLFSHSASYSRHILSFNTCCHKTSCSVVTMLSTSLLTSASHSWSQCWHVILPDENNRLNFLSLLNWYISTQQVNNTRRLSLFDRLQRFQRDNLLLSCCNLVQRGYYSIITNDDQRYFTTIIMKTKTLLS